jgi:hypothetical protein
MLLAGDVFILHATGVFTRIRSVATPARTDPIYSATAVMEAVEKQKDTSVDVFGKGSCGE